MKKGQRRLLLVLLSALMIFFVCGLNAYADDEVIGLRTSTHKIVIKNYTRDKIKVMGLTGSDLYTKVQAGKSTVSYTEPDILTGIYSNDLLRFDCTEPAYVVSASSVEGYRYCLSFIDEEEYTDDVILKIQKDRKALLVSLNYNDGTDFTDYMTVVKGENFCLPDSVGFVRDGYELAGWQNGEDFYEPGAELSLLSDTSFDAVWRHVHKWSLTGTGSNTATLSCLNEGCEWSDKPVTITLEAKDDTYSEDGYDVSNVVVSADGDLPEGVVCTGDIAFTGILGKKYELPKDAWMYKASVTLSLSDGSGEPVRLTDSFRIKRAINLRIPILDPPIIEGWTEGDKPNKPDLSWTIAKNPLALYCDEESFGKIMVVIAKVQASEESLTIDDFKGIKVSLIPPSKAGSYAIVVAGISKNHFDLGLNVFTVGELTGVLDANISCWTYGEYDQAVNGPTVTVDGNDVTGAAVCEYKPLLSGEEEPYAAFDPDEAAAIDAGMYLMKITVVDNSATDEAKETYRIFKVSKAYTEATEPAGIEGIVADGEEHELVTAGECDGGVFAYSVHRRGENDGDSRIVTFDPPMASEAGTYIVRYRLITDRNHYSPVIKGRIKVVIEPAPEPAEEPVVEPETGGDEQPGSDVQPGSDEQPGGDVTPPADDNTEDNTQVVKRDSSLPVIEARNPSAGKTSVKVRWKKLSKESRHKCDGIEVRIASDKKFKSDCVSAVKGKKATSCRIGSLGRKTTYYVKVRTYKYRNGVKYVSKWSKVKKIRTR